MDVATSSAIQLPIFVEQFRSHSASVRWCNSRSFLANTIFPLAKIKNTEHEEPMKPASAGRPRELAQEEGSFVTDSLYDCVFDSSFHCRFLHTSLATRISVCSQSLLEVRAQAYK